MSSHKKHANINTPFKLVKQQRGKKSWQRGWWTEWIACAYLMLKGYRFLARRYRTPFGEIDLIMRHGTYVVFVEVKSRPTIETAAYAIGFLQQQRLHKAALKYLTRYPKFPNVRFDVVFLTKRNRIKHLKNAWSMGNT